MFPELLRIGTFVITTKGVLLVLAFLATAFAFWRKSREEHYHEEQVFDAFLLAVLVGLMVGRLGFAVIHWEEFIAQPWRVFDVMNKGGGHLAIGLVGASVYLYQYARRKKWDAYEVLDFWCMSVALGLVFVSVGNLLAGVGFGNETHLPWGMVFPGVFTKHHPVQLYSALFFVALHMYLSWAEFHYRTFIWYRAGKKTAQTGFLTSIFILAVGVFSGLLQLVAPAQWVLQGLSVDLLLSILLVMYGALLLYVRSGRSLLFWQKKDTNYVPFANP